MRNLYVMVVVVLAVLIGFIYYWSDVRENTIDGSPWFSKGFLFMLRNVK